MALEFSTDRARRLFVFAAFEARRCGATEVELAHLLFALARDAATPIPHDEIAPGAADSTLARLPVREVASLALELLGELGVSGERLAAVTGELNDLTPPAELILTEPIGGGSVVNALSRATRRAVYWQLRMARHRGDVHLDTRHALMGVIIAGSRSSRPLLAQLGIDSRRRLTGLASPVLEAASADLNEQSYTLAEASSEVAKALIETFPASRKTLRQRARGR